ncbi:MAG: hypothetical protein L3J62_00285 [Gammaproteobacteria bacterium]|nr:hypothetical protein [Gammaproteobacteria bacterium]MCF6229218.1 hypothetical protein [Gammaproteobacteria bacterium]
MSTSLVTSLPTMLLATRVLFAAQPASADDRALLLELIDRYNPALFREHPL